MSVSYSVVGFRPPDERWVQMKAVWDVCKAAGIQAPNEVQCFLANNRLSGRGIMIELPSDALSKGSGYVQVWYEVEIAKLPVQVTHIRFTIEQKD